MDEGIAEYHKRLARNERSICNKLATLIDRGLPSATSKIWHAHPVWFLDGNPIVGYSQQKLGIRLMFWSGADFDEPDLKVRGGKFKDASIFFQQSKQIDEAALRRWLTKSIAIQWDYKNIVRRKGKLIRLNNAAASEPGERPRASSRSTASQKSIEAEVRALISKFAPDSTKLVASIRKALRKRLPSANELVYAYRTWFVISYSPTDKGHQGVLGIRGDAKGIRLFLNNGKDLPDPARLLQGTGTQSRWMPIERVATLSQSEVVDLIEASIAHASVPFADAGHGETMMRAGS